MKVLVILAGIMVLGACAKKSDTQVTDVTPPPIQQGDGNPVTPPAPPPPIPPVPPPTTQYPTAEFEFNQYLWTSPSIDLHGHIMLSKASTEAIALNINLIDGTATYPRDYLGFYCENSRSYTIVFAPGERLVHLPSIDVADAPVCGGKFFMTMSAGADTKVVLGSQAEILLDCK